MPAWITDLDAATALMVVGVLVALAILTRRAWPTIRGIVHIVDLLTGLQATLDKIMGQQRENTRQIGDIHHETHRNDGSSIKDATLRLEAGLAAFTEETRAALTELTAQVTTAISWIATHEEHSDQVVARLDDVAETVEHVQQLIDPDA